MVLEPDRATFKRLIWSYIGTTLVIVLVLVPQFFDPGWVEFGAEFDALVEAKFGTPDEPTWLLATELAALLALGAWAIASTIGLFWFKRWARFGF